MGTRTIEEQVAAVDWDEIARKNRLDSLGAELYETGKRLTEFSELPELANSLTVLSSVMDIWRTSRPIDSGLDDEPGIVAAGYAAAMVRDSLSGLGEEEDE